MKIAIQGHLTRGKEVIQILESLGGINDGLHEGNNPDCYYELHGNIIWCVSTKGINFKYYTLEEFEKECPFKVGDKVTFKDYNYPYTIKSFDICFGGDIACKFEEDGRYYSINKLKLYKEMKEERNITLTLDKAKEWYHKGGELKEIALQAFTEKELTKIELPKTWEEFCANYMINDSEAYFDTCGTIYSADATCRHSQYDKNVCPSKKSAEAHLVMIQLEQLRDCWRQGWKPTPHQTVFAIKFAINGLGVYEYCSREFLSFKDRKTATEFLKCFRDLIEKAGDLI